MGSEMIIRASRTLAAVFGGYALAACATTALALWLPAAPATAVITGNLLSFLIYTVAVLWAFATTHLTPPPWDRGDSGGCLLVN